MERFIKDKDIIEDMRNGQKAKKLQEEDFADFDFESDDDGFELDISSLLASNPDYKMPHIEDSKDKKINIKDLSLDEVIEIALEEGKPSFAVGYAFQEGYVEKAQELYYKYFSNFKSKNKDKIWRIGLLAEKIGLHYEAFRKFVRTDDYVRAILHGKKSGIKIPLQYIKLAIDKNIELNSHNVKEIAEIIGLDSDKETKNLFLKAVDYLESKKESNWYMEMQNHYRAVSISLLMGDYEILIRNYLKIKDFINKGEIAKKATLKKKYKCEPRYKLKINLLTE